VSVTVGDLLVVVAPADVMGVRIEGDRAQRWSARVLDVEDLPVLEADGTRGVGGGLFRHGLGPVHAAVSCDQPLRLTFFQLCDCEGSCESERHRAPMQIAAIEPTTSCFIQFPEAPGVMAVETAASWSIIATKDASAGMASEPGAQPAPTADVPADIPALVRAEVARLLPGLVAEQLAALGVTASAARDAAADQPASRRDKVAPWLREAREAVDDFENQLATIDVGDGGDATSTELGRYHWIATHALEKANRILDEAGRRDQSKAVFAEIGRGREALVRLDALRRGRPVPLEILTQEELAGPPKPDSAVHTAERFAWKGQGGADFYLDRPFPHRTVLLEVEVGGSRWVDLVMMERTDAVVAERSRQTHWSNGIELVAAAPEITHVKITDAESVPWSVRSVDPQAYPFLEDMTRGEGRRVFRHQLGAVDVTVQCLQGVILTFYELCDCTKSCNKPEHLDGESVAAFSGEARDHCRLPKKQGLLAIEGSGRWSLDITPKASSAR
jgi:hypothetical protein